MSAPAVVTESTFKSEVLDSDNLVLVDFWAPWCGPCKLIAPVLDELASQYDGSIKVAKVNVDENQGLAGQYGIRSIPSLLFLKNGEVVASVVGAASKQVIEQKIAAING